MLSTYAATKKLFSQVRSFDDAPIMGEPYRCFLTGEKVDYLSYRVFKIESTKGIKTYKFYLSPMYHTMGRSAISFIEEKILKLEVEK